MPLASALLACLLPLASAPLEIPQGSPEPPRDPSEAPAEPRVLSAGSLRIPLPADWQFPEESILDAAGARVTESLDVDATEFAAAAADLQIALLATDPATTLSVQVLRGDLSVDEDVLARFLASSRAQMEAGGIEIDECDGKLAEVAGRQALRMTSLIRMAGSEGRIRQRIDVLPGNGEHALVTQSAPADVFADRMAAFDAVLGAIEYPLPAPDDSSRFLRTVLIGALSGAIAAVVGIRINRRKPLRD